MVKRLRGMIQKLRRTPIPISDVVPMLIQAADKIDALEAEIERLRKALKTAQEFVEFCWRDVSLNDFAEDFRSKAEREIDAALAAKGGEHA